MKKSLLLSGMLAIGLAASAAVDPATYTSGVEGYTFQNLMSNTLIHGEWFSYFQADGFGKLVAVDVTPTAAVYNGKIYVVQAKKAVADSAPDWSSSLAEFSLETGEYIRTIQLTLDGAEQTGVLWCENLQVDDFGNLWFSSNKSYMWTPGDDGGKANPMTVYTVDVATGACTLQASLTPTVEVGGVKIPDETIITKATDARIDFIGLSGDVTRKQGPCTVMFAPAKDAALTVYAFRCDQGEDDWYAGFPYSFSIEIEGDNTYPVIEAWGQCNTISIVKDEDYTSALFYLHDNAALPMLYSDEGAVIDTFESVNDTDNELTPTVGTCGLIEFKLGEMTFLAYGWQQHDKGIGVQARLVALPDETFASMKKVADYPADGMGKKGENGHGEAPVGGGRRIHNNQVYKYDTDAAGHNAAYIFTFRHGCGFATYLLAEEGYESGIQAPMVENANAPVEYFNLQGMRVENPENGIFVRRQGSSVAKVAL